LKGNSVPVSVLILTHNEAVNISRCLESVSWSNDVVVLDSGSHDGTTSIAADAGARVFHRPFDNFANQRNHAIDQIEFRHSWVLHLDADEVVTPELRDEIVVAVEREEFSAFLIPSKTLFMGKWLKHAGMYPSYQVRLGRIDHLRFKQVGHGQREDLPIEQIGRLENAYLHYSFSKGFEDWIAKHNRYSTDEARRNVEIVAGKKNSGSRSNESSSITGSRRALKDSAANMPFRSFARFVYMYVFRLGFLDGRAGFTYCRLLAMYEYWIALKMREYQSDSGI
jgi:glycosyltransferase involved in cell wall biosynthesis